MNNKIISRAVKIVGLCCILSGCSIAPSQTSQSTACSAHAGFSNGMNDAAMGKPMNSNVGAYCLLESQTGLQQAYQEGYLKGLENSKREITDDVTPVSDVNIIVAPVHGMQRPRKSDEKKYYCEVKAFGKNYYSFGLTELEAKLKTRLFCQEGNGDNSIFCRDEKISCQTNK